jgi:hypothetical protein
VPVTDEIIIPAQQKKLIKFRKGNSVIAVIRKEVSITGVSLLG